MEFTIIAEPKSLLAIDKPCVVFKVITEGLEYVAEVFAHEYPDWEILTYDRFSVTF